MRYLRTHLPGPSEAWRAWRLTSGVDAPHHRERRPIGWTLHNHRMRLDARYRRLGEEWMSATGLPLLDPQREQARANRLARQAQLAAARESTEERELTEAGYVLTRGRHQVAECIVVTATGETAYIGRRSVRTHNWTGRPHVYARGLITHPEHCAIDLGTSWHEVVPNRAHGPFAVGSLGIGWMD